MSGLMNRLERIEYAQKNNTRLECLSPHEVANRLGLNVKMVQRHLRLKRIRGVKLGRKWMVPVSELERILNVASNYEAENEPSY